MPSVLNGLTVVGYISFSSSLDPTCHAYFMSDLVRKIDFNKIIGQFVTKRANQYS